MPSDEERVAADPALLDDARRRYRGRGDLADQLWWLARPGEPTPAGNADPDAEIEAARRDLYRPGRRSVDPGDLQRREHDAKADRSSARRAVAEALAAAQDARTAPALPAGRRRLRPVAVLLGVAVVAFAAGAFAGNALATDPGAGTAEALRVFERPQAAADRPGADALPSEALPATARRLRDLSTVGTEVYGARTRDGRVCLVAVVLATRAAASCTRPSAFAQAGLSLVVHADADPVDDSGRTPSSELALLWEPDGDLGITPTPLD